MYDNDVYLYLLCAFYLQVSFSGCYTVSHMEHVPYGRFYDGRGYSPRSGVDWVSRSAIHPAAGRTIEAVVLYAPQRDGQEKQLCYSPRSWASKSNITRKVI